MSAHNDSTSSVIRLSPGFPVASSISEKEASSPGTCYLEDHGVMCDTGSAGEPVLSRDRAHPV